MVTCVEIIIRALRTARWSPMTSKVPFVKFTRAATRLEMDLMSAAITAQHSTTQSVSSPFLSEHA